MARAAVMVTVVMAVMAVTEVAGGAVLGEGRYRLQRRLGAGGMATVWLASDERLDRQVAVKVMADTLAGDPRYLKRFAREARAAASVSHPNIVPVYDYGAQDGRPYLVMEYIAGGNLAARLAAGHGRVLDSVALAEQLLDALEDIHGAGLVHRDVKPSNILLDPQERPRLSDFGIAQPENATALTQTGMVLGTLSYLAPEVVAGAKASPASDLYSAGVVLGEVMRCCGGAELAPLIAALTARRPEDRPDSAAAARRWLVRDAATSRRPTAPTRPLTTPTAIASATARTRRVVKSEPMRAALSRIPQRARWATAAVLVVALALLISLASHGGDHSAASSGARTVAPAPPTAPLSDQLRSLSAIVDHLAQR